MACFDIGGTLLALNPLTIPILERIANSQIEK